MRKVSTGRRAVFAALAALVLAGGAHAREARLRTEPLVIQTGHGPARFTVEIADTDATREHGLMFRTSLAPDRGMLFDFKTPQPVAFWMKNTLIPLDMIFIAADGRIVSIARHAQPHDETPIPSGGTVLGVLEIAGDRAAALDIQPGDRVKARIFHGG